MSKKKAKPSKKSKLIVEELAENAAKAFEGFDEPAEPAQDEEHHLDAEDLEELNDTLVENADAEDEEAIEAAGGHVDAHEGEEEHVEGLEASASDQEADETEDTAELTDDEENEATEADDAEFAGSELEGFEAADIEDIEKLDAEQIRSVVESVLFATDKPLSIAVIKQSFKGTQVRSKDIRQALTELHDEYNESWRGFSLDEVGGGFQLRTKVDNLKYLRQAVKARPFKLSGPALEVMSIVAYKQPVTKSQMDEIRGVESGHLLRALMEKGLVSFGERSDLPGKPMFYETTRKFLEIFGLRNLQELPSLHEIDQLIPEGIGDIEDKETLSDLTEGLSEEIKSSYSEGEEELLKITDELQGIETSSDFFEKEKERMRAQRDKERAQNIREALAVGEAVEEKDKRWLERYESMTAEAALAAEEVAMVTEDFDPVAIAEAHTETSTIVNLSAEELPPIEEPLEGSRPDDATAD